MRARLVVLLVLVALTATAADAWPPWGRRTGPNPVGPWHGPGTAPCTDTCPAQWATDSFPSCTALPGSPSYLWEARRESFNDGDAVGTMSDFGSVGVDLVQGTAGAKPTFHDAGGPGDRPYFSFDGGDYVKSSAEGTSLAQPNLVAMVIYTATTGNYTMLDGFDANPRTRIGTVSTSAPWQIQTSATTLSANNTVVNGQWELVVGYTNGASSYLRISGLELATGDAGAHAYAPGTIGCNYTGASCFTGGVALAVVYDTAPDVNALEAAIEDCYGSFPQ